MNYAPDRSDFWNDPSLWNGISDPHTQMCWMDRDVNDLPPAINAAIDGIISDSPRDGYMDVLTPDGRIQTHHHSELGNVRMNSAGIWYASASRPADASQAAA